MIYIRLMLGVVGVLGGALASASAEPIRGVSLAHLHRPGIGYGSDDCRKQLTLIRDVGADWIAISDYAYMPAVDRPELRWSVDPTISEQHLVRGIEDAHARGLKVMLKPHIWSHQFRSGKWHGDIQMNDEADWDEWFAQYGKFLLEQARIAETARADMLCIGVEYQGTSASQEARWRKLIADVRKVYSGPITYASAYGEWPHIKWWDAVDYIGIDAYFPVADKHHPSEAEVRAGWRHIYGFLEPFARQCNKPLLFTEIGYSASPKAALEPWAYDEIDPDPAFQAMLYRVALEECQKRDYVAGVFIWKWFTSDRFRKDHRRDAFAMQDREEVLNVLRKLWRRSPRAMKPETSPASSRHREQ